MSLMISPGNYLWGSWYPRRSRYRYSARWWSFRPAHPRTSGWTDQGLLSVHWLCFLHSLQLRDQAGSQDWRLVPASRFPTCRGSRRRKSPSGHWPLIGISLGGMMYVALIVPLTEATSQAMEQVLTPRPNIFQKKTSVSNLSGTTSPIPYLCAFKHLPISSSERRRFPSSSV